MNLILYEVVFQHLKHFIIEKSEFSVNVLKKPKTDIYPMVVMQEISNVALSKTKGCEAYSFITFEINIYTKDMLINGERTDSMEIGRYIQKLVSSYMEDTIGLNRVMAQPTPNVDETIYRITMRYQGKASDYRSRFF